MRVTIDLGFSFLLLFSVACVIVPAIAFAVYFRRQRDAARAEEIKRLLVLAEEEASRAEIEASYQFGDVSYQFGAVPVPVVAPEEKRCAVCYCPTTSRCARCKAVHYCSGKCQIVHWRQGHKDKCQPPSSTLQTDDVLNDLGKKVAEPHYHVNKKSPIKSTECTTSSEISQAKVDNDRLESLQEGDVTDPNLESSSNSFSGFSASTSARESSDDPSICKGVTLTEHERSRGHNFADPIHDISDTTSHRTSIGNASLPFSPKISSLADSVDRHKLNQVRPEFGQEESKITPNGTSGFRMHKGETIEPSTVPSGLWNRTLDSTGIKDHSKSDILLSHTDDTVKSVENNVPYERSAPAKKDQCVDSSGCTDVSRMHNFQTVGSKASNHVVFNPGSTLKSAESRSLPCAFADAKLVSRSEEHSHYTTKCPNGIQSGTATSSEVISSSPNSKNDPRTSVLNVADQFRGTNLSKHSPLPVGSDISGKYTDKGLFPYDLFVKLYNWNRVELQPFGLINCGNSCYANAVLQCLAFTPPLTAYLLQGLHSKSCVNKNWCFTCALESLIMKSKDTKYPVSPQGIISQLENIGSQLSSGREEDAHEFLRLAVETMQSVCLMETGAKTSDTFKEETNLIGLTFGGYLQSKIKCMKCGGKSERQERMMDLTVEIDGEIATLEEALQQFTSTETLDGENKYHCVRCKSYEKAKKKMTISEAPNVLTVALKRFQSGKFGKLNKPIQFPEILDLAPFMSGTGDLPIYRLYGVVVHLDVMNAAFSGHYVCYVKNFQSRWFKVDDSVVSAVELEKVLTKGAYMLFYARCSPRAPRLIRNSLVSSDSKWKVHGKTVTKKSRHVSMVPGAREASLDCSPALENFYSKFHHLKGILEDDSCSDNSSLISSNSDEGSSSTDSTCDSTSTDDLPDYNFGDLGRGVGGIVRNSDSDISCALSYSHLNSKHLHSSDINSHDSIFSHASGFQPPHSGAKVERDGLLYRSRSVDIKRSGGGVCDLHPYTTVEQRKLDTSSGISTISFKETDSVQGAGSNHFNDRHSGVSYIKPRDRTD